MPGCGRGLPDFRIDVVEGEHLRRQQPCTTARALPGGCREQHRGSPSPTITGLHRALDHDPPATTVSMPRQELHEAAPTSWSICPIRRKCSRTAPAPCRSYRSRSLLPARGWSLPHRQHKPMSALFPARVDGPGSMTGMVISGNCSPRARGDNPQSRPGNGCCCSVRRPRILASLGGRRMAYRSKEEPWLDSSPVSRSSPAAPRGGGRSRRPDVPRPTRASAPRLAACSVGCADAGDIGAPADDRKCLPASPIGVADPSPLARRAPYATFAFSLQKRV